MNHDTPASSPLLAYYDHDHPWPEDPGFDAAVADPFVMNEIGRDVAFFAEFARAAEGPVLDVCCGTGRLTIPIARLGRRVHGIDISPELLSRFAERLAAEATEVRERCQAHLADARDFEIDERFALACIGFNSLCMLPDRESQMRALKAVNRHLAANGRVIVDLTNPLLVPLAGVSTPGVILSRQIPSRGLSYSRWLTRRAMDEQQRQLLEGWYDIVDGSGTVRREHYTSTFRYLFRGEAELMLEMSGFAVESVYGTHGGTPWLPLSPKIILVARKVGAPLA